MEAKWTWKLGTSGMAHIVYGPNDRGACNARAVTEIREVGAKCAKCVAFAKKLTK